MPPTLFATNDHAPYSTSMQMPNVFVVPPDEDEQPAWCYFDANEPASALDASSNPNFPDDSLNMLEAEPDAPWYPREPFEFQGLISRKNGETRSIMDILMNDDYLDADDELDIYIGSEADVDADVDEGPAPDNEAGHRSIGNDSDVVEVVKVGRRYSDNLEDRPQSTPPTKPSKSFKSRASKALRSLKIVGKGSRSKNKNPPPFIHPLPSTSEVETPPKEKPTLSRRVSRRGSAIFSQIFTPPSTPTSAFSFEVIGDAPSPPSKESKKYPSSLSNGVPSISRQPDSTPESPTSFDFGSSTARNPSPTPTARTPSSRRGFSIKTLGRVFSLSSSDETSYPAQISTTRKCSGSSPSSSTGPETPTEESTPLPSNYVCRQKDSPVDEPPLDPRDVSFELKLDSLHFDSLSFDADRF